jgi:hypothetical protein
MVPHLTARIFLFVQYHRYWIASHPFQTVVSVFYHDDDHVSSYLVFIKKKRAKDATQHSIFCSVFYLLIFW